MINKKFMFLTIFLLSLLAVSAVSAADNITDNAVNIEETTNEAVSADENQAILKENNNVGTFDELANEINAVAEGSVLNLTKDYKYTTGSRYGIQINKAITIDGKGHTLDGNKLTKIFDVRANEVTLKDITFINGYDKYNSGGGAVEWKGTNGVLTNCTFINSYTKSDGAAVTWKGSNAVLTNCNFINSTGFIGGAVRLVSANGVLANCSFINSSASGSAGAVSIYGANGVLANCSFINSSAKGGAGAIEFCCVKGVLANCSFINCSATDRDVVWAHGGAVCLFYNNIILANCSFINTSAYWDGGAVYWKGNNGVLTNCIFINSSAEKGGAVYLHTSSTNSILSDCSFVNCSAKSGNDYSYGGAIRWNADLGIVAHSTFVNCSARSDNKAYYGGGIYFKGNNCSLINSTFKGCSAKYGHNWYSVNPLTIINQTKSPTAIIASDVVATYKSNANIVATLKDIEGNPIRGAKVKITFNGADKTLTTDNNKGQVSIPLKNVYPGNYMVAIGFDGDMAYEKTNTTINVIINKADTIISAPDITVAYKDTKGKLVATITNQYNNPLPVNVNVNINGKTYTMKADTEGKITIPTKTLYPGTYTATITYTGNNNYNPTTTTVKITVNKADSSISSPSVSVAYKDPNGKLVATITNQYGKPLPVNVNININGKTTTIKADTEGKITIPTKTLYPGTYTATITYTGNNNYNPTNTTTNIVVTKANTNINAPDITVNQGDANGKLVTTITNQYNNPLPVNLNININGQTHTIKADSNGQATWPTKNLAKGTYTATITYAGNGNYNPTNTTTKITVK